MGYSLPGPVDQMERYVRWYRRGYLSSTGECFDIGNTTRTALERFITTGIDDETRATIGDPPHGRGILGVLVRDAQVLRLRDLQKDPRSVGFPPNHPPFRQARATH